MKIKFDKRDVDSIKSLYEDGESFDYIANLHETHPELIKEVLKEKLRDVSGENVSVRLL